jgi:hypothetical protein
MNLFAKYNQIVDQDNMFTITASLFNSKWDQSGQVPDEAVTEGSISRWGSLDPTEGGNTQRYNLSVRSMHQLNDGGVMNNLVYYTRYTFDLYSNFTFYLEDQVNGDQIRQKETRNLYGYQGSYNKTYSLPKGSTIETQFGGGFRFDEILDIQLLSTSQRLKVIDTSNYGNIYETNINLYGQASWINKKWMVNLGLRFDGFKFEYLSKTTDVYQPLVKYQYIVNPKVNVAFNVNPDLQLYVKLGQGFHSNDARVVTQNDSLPTLPVALGSDLGLNWKPLPRMIINAAVWYLYLESEMVWSGDGGTWEPSGQTNRLGADLSLRWQILNWLFFDLDVTYSHARLIDEPEEANYVPLAPIWTSTGGLTMTNLGGWSAALRYRMMSDRPADETNSVVALGYAILDLKVNYTYRKWTFSLSVENLLDSNWNEAQFAGDYRITPTSDAGYGLTFTPGTPFFFKGGVALNF